MERQNVPPEFAGRAMGLTGCVFFFDPTKMTAGNEELSGGEMRNQHAGVFGGILYNENL